MNLQKDRALTTYMLFGGLPQVVQKSSKEEKNEYLKGLFTHTYIKDIKERYSIKNIEMLDELLNILASDIGALINPTKLTNTFESVKYIKVNRMTLTSYLEYICDSFPVDFVCNMGSRRYYIQSAYRMPDEEKIKQEEASLRNIDDFQENHYRRRKHSCFEKRSRNYHNRNL